MDRSVLESDPHRVLEGMAIAGYAVGADQGYIYVRGEYPLAIQRLDKAIKQARKLRAARQPGLRVAVRLPDRHPHRRRRVRLRRGDGADRLDRGPARRTRGRGPPTPRQPGLWGDPTLINNVETFANIPPIIRRGADWFAGDRHREEQGDQGLRAGRQDPQHRAGRGADGDHAPRRSSRRSAAARPSGHDQGRADRRALGRLHPGRAPRHAGRLRVARRGGLDHGLRRHDRHGPDHQTWWTSPGSSWSSAWTSRAASASPAARAPCSCTGCCTRIARGPGRPHDDLEQLEALCDMVKHTSLCGLGQSAPNPVLSTLRYFRARVRGAVCDEPDGQTGARPSPVVHARRLIHGGQDADNQRQAPSARLAEQTILEAAREAGIAIPTLCHLEGRRTSAPAGSAWSRVGGGGRLAASLRHPRRRGDGWRSRPTRRGCASIAA